MEKSNRPNSKLEEMGWMFAGLSSVFVIVRLCPTTSLINKGESNPPFLCEKYESNTDCNERR